MKIFKKILYNSYFYTKRLGYLQTLKFFFKKFLRYKEIIKIEFKKNEYFIRTNEHDLDVLISNLDKEFECLKNINLSEDQLIVDAGAYIGSSSIRLSQLFKKNQIIAIEPFKENYDILLKNVEKYKNIIPINSALVSSNHNEEIFLYKSKTGAWGNNILKDTHDKRNLDIIYKVKKIDLKSLIEKFNKQISILKLDIEGSEKMIVENDKDILNDIDIIIVELHKKINKDIEEIFFSFAKNRYNFYFDKEKVVSVKKDKR
jgi:FkbM family methyltransferase